MDELELINLNRKIGKAERRRDEEFLRGVLADTLVFKRADGSTVSKTEYLAQLMNIENTYEYLFTEDIQATQNGNTALVSLLICARGKRGKKEFSGVFRNQRLFIKQGENWQCHIWVNSRVS